MTTDTLYYLPNAREDKQRAEMVALEAAHICIFCPESYDYGTDPKDRQLLLEYPGDQSWKKQVLLDNGHWVLLRNEYPYDGTLHHFLLVPRRHVTSMSDLVAVEWVGFDDLLAQVVKQYNLEEDFSVVARNGNMAHTGATIAHLHFQLVQADPDWQGEPIKFFVSSSARPADPPPA